MAVAAVLLGACGGGSDNADDSTTTSLVEQTVAPTEAPTIPTTAAPTLPPAPTTVAYVTEGAAVMVTNASRVNGAAGRMTDRLALVGYATVTPGNYTLGQLDVTKIYFDSTNPAAQGVADGLKAAFGGGAIEVLAMPSVPPVDSGDLTGAGVVIAMGNDVADKSLDELQGIVTPTSAPADTEAPGSSAPDSEAPPTT